MKPHTLWWMMKWCYKWLVRSETSCSAFLLSSVLSKSNSQAWSPGQLPGTEGNWHSTVHIYAARLFSPTKAGQPCHPWLTAVSRTMLENCLRDGWLGWVLLLHPYWSKGLQGWCMALPVGVLGTWVGGKVGFWILRQVVLPSVQDIYGSKKIFKNPALNFVVLS